MLAITSLTVFCSSSSFAQDAEQPVEEKRYKVELILFERLLRADDFDQEVWRNNFKLSYPAATKRLIDPKTQNAKLEQLERLKQEKAELRDRLNSFSEENWPTTEEELQAAESPETGTDGETKSDSNTTGITGDEPLASSSETGLEPDANDDENSNSGAQEEPKVPAFTLLGNEALSLVVQKEAIDEQDNMRVLFHQAWEQPLVDSASSPSIVIAAGDKFGEHFELEGTIKLSVARYLHLEANLWLTSFEPNFGQDLEFWPELPEIPLDPLDRILQLEIDASAAQQINEEKPNLHFNEHEQAVFSTVQPDQSEYSTELPKLDFHLLNDNQENALYSAITSDKTDKPYLIKEIIVMEQRRRMRSKEIHYLDHPRIGLVIRLEPVISKPEENGITGF